MSNCLRCGSPYEPHHKFCGTCAAPIAPAMPQSAMPAPGYGAPHAPGHQAGPPQARCQLGHEIAQGFTYCPQGHPIALEAMQLAGGDAFGAPRPPTPEPQSPNPPPAYGDAQGPTGAMSPFPNAGHAAQVQPYPAPPAQPQAPMAPPAAAPAYAQPSPSTADTTPQATPSGRKLMGFLVSFHGNPLGAFFPLYSGVNRIGRAGAAEGLDVAIADPATSSNHANLHLDPASSRVVLEDLGSTNGTFANDDRLPHAGHRDLANGDRIRFGSYTAKLLIVPQG